SRRLIRGLDRTLLLTAIRVGNDQPRSWHPDPLNSTGQEARGAVGHCEQPKLEARRAAVDRQDAGSISPLGGGATPTGVSLGATGVHLPPPSHRGVAWAKHENEIVLCTFGRCRQLDATGPTRAAGLTTKPGPDAKPRNRANRCCRQRAYQVCLAESRVR